MGLQGIAPRFSTTLVPAIALALLAAGSAWPAELWVDRNSLGGPCNDSRSRGQVTAATPWCTLGAAGNAVLPGDMVRVRAGVYSEQQTCSSCWGAVLQPMSSGTSGQPIRFSAYNGETVLINDDGGAGWGILIAENGSLVPRFIEMEGFDVQGGFRWGCVTVADTSDVILRSFDVSGCVESAVKFSASYRVTLEDSFVHHNHLEGWTSAVNLGVCKSGNVVRGNAIWGNTDEDPEERESEGHAIIMDTCGDDGGALIENNIIWDNEGYCINIYKSDGAIVRNNTCWKNAVGRPDKVEVSLRGDYISFHNNVVVSAAGTRTLRILGSEVDYATITSDHNLHWSLDRDNVITWPPGTWGTVEEFKAQNPYGWGAASTQLDPRLVESGPRFLEPTYGSPVIDTGDNSWSPAEDYLEVPRPLDGDGDGNNTADRGAFEFGRVFEDGFETGLTDKWSDVFE